MSACACAVRAAEPGAASAAAPPRPVLVHGVRLQALRGRVGVRHLRVSCQGVLPIL